MKKPQPKFKGAIKKDNKGDNRIVLDNTYYYQKFLNTNFKLDDKITITIKKFYRNRTTGNKHKGEKGNQNGYLYAVVLPMISEKVGMTTDEVLASLENMLCITGENKFGMPTVLRFKEMNTVEFNYYLGLDEEQENPKSVIKWAKDFLEMEIPLPDKEYKNRGYELDIEEE